MKFSENWINEFVNLSNKEKLISKNIIMSGIEVNSIKPVSYKFSGVIIGKIIKCKKIINKKIFFINKIDIGNKKYLNIISNNLDCNLNINVAVAPYGSILYKKKIKKFIKNGFLSEGILCSNKILGISNLDNKLIILDKNAPLGKDIREYLFLNDNIIDVNIPTNRSDCNSIFGLAREILVSNKLKIKLPNIKYTKPSLKEKFSIKIKNKNYCNSVLFKIIKKVNLNVQTPIYIKEKIKKSGFKSINIINDIINYVLLEFGIPIEIFDYDKIKKKIILRKSKKNENITLFKNKKINLISNTLILSDKKQPISIAGGIVNNLYYNPNILTKNIILTSFLINPKYILGKNYDYKLFTESFNRYEKGIDPSIQEYVLEYITNLIIKFCNGKVVYNIKKIKNKKYKKKKIFLNIKKINCLIGFVISKVDIYKILNLLDFNINIINNNIWEILIPSWRFDISIEEDLIEEIIRIYGYNLIPNNPIFKKNSYIKNSKKKISLNRVKILLSDLGYQEIITYSFVNFKKQSLIYPNIKPLKLSKIILKDVSVMRVSLLTGLIETIIYNQNRQQKQIRLFESGYCFIPDKYCISKIKQNFMLSGAISGFYNNKHWFLKDRLINFFDIKGDLESIFDLTNKINNFKFKEYSHNALHPGQSASIFFKNKMVGFIGAIHPFLEKKIGLKQKTVVFELNWNKINFYKKPIFKKIIKYPIHRHDISIIVKEDIKAYDIINLCKKTEKNILYDIKIFDIYNGKSIKKGFKSISIQLILQNNLKTLCKEDINLSIKKIIFNLIKKFNASLR